MWTASLPSSGLSVVLAPLTLALSAVAWRRSRHDAVLWIGLALNALLVLGLLGLIVGVLTGDVSIGWE